MKGYSRSEELFCQKLLETGNQSEAYRFAYNVKAETLDKSVNEAGSRLANKGKIVTRLNQLRNLGSKRHHVTTEKLTNMYLMAFHQAISLENPGAAVQATTGLGKLHGLIIERASVDNTGSITVQFKGVSRTLELLREFRGNREDQLSSESMPDRPLLSHPVRSG